MLNFNDVITRCYQRWPERPFVYQKCDGQYQSISFGQFIDDVRALAAALNARGHHGKRLMLLADNSINWMICDLAIMRYVGSSAGLSKALAPTEMVAAIDKIDASALLYDATQTKVVENLKRSHPHIDYINMDDALADIIADGKRLLATENDCLNIALNPNACVKIVFTSGTTGTAKAVMLSEANIFAGWNSLYRRAPLNQDDCCYLFLPLYHTYGGIYNFIYGLVAGMTIYLSSGVEHIASELIQVQPTVFCAVPLIYTRFYSATKGNPDLLKQCFGNKVKYLFTGGAVIDSAMRKDYRQAGLNLLNAYALSETASSLAIEYTGSDNATSVGTIYEDIDVIIANPSPQGVGEIRVKGDNVFLGYLNDDTATKNAFDAHGYFKTGDLGYIDKARNLYFVRRQSNMLRTVHGQFVDPDAVACQLANNCQCVNKVKIFLDKQQLKATFYVTNENNDDYPAIVDNYNQNAPAHARIHRFNVVLDSITRRLKQ